jgi:putative transposase
VAALEARRDLFSAGDGKRAPSERKLAELRREIARCWRKYEARNNDLAHLAANILILLASVWQADLIAGEDLKSLKSQGRGRGAKGRWVNWRNNAQIRGALWRTLRYKCHLAGIRLAWQHPLWQACPDLCLPCPPGSCAQSGSVAALCGLRLEWGQRLCCGH